MTGASNLEVIAAAEAVVGQPIDYEVGPRRPGDPPVLVASAERAGGPGLAAAATGPRRDGRLGVGLAPAHPDGYAD